MKDKNEWISLVGATPVVLILITWSISRQRNHEKHVLSRNASKYITLFKTILSISLFIQFSIFIYSLLYKLLSIENYAFILIFTIETLRLVKSLLSLSLVVVNSMHLSRSFISYHICLLFLLSASIHVPILLHELSDLTHMDLKLFTYYVSVHCVIFVSCVLMILGGIFKYFCKKCSNVGCENSCSCAWSPKTCIFLMLTIVLFSDAVFVITLLLEQYPQFHLMLENINFDHSSAILLSQVIEGIIVVLILDPYFGSRCSTRKHQMRLLESPTSSYHLSGSDGRINNNRGRRGSNNNNLQGLKFPITNGSLFATMQNFAMNVRGNYNLGGGFDLKSESRDNTFDKFKTYTKDMDFENSYENHSVTTICNDEFDFELPTNTNNKQHEAFGDSTYINKNHIKANLANNNSHSKNEKQQQDISSLAHVSLNLFESASMNDLDTCTSSVSNSCHHTTRLYKKNSKFKNDKKVFRRVQSAENLSSAGILIISNNHEWI